MANQGEQLAALTRHFHELRTAYLRWAAGYGQSSETNLGHYRRALIGWYEARIDPEHPYLGPPERYVQRVAAVYFAGRMNEAVVAADRRPDLATTPTEANPLDHLPRPVHLNGTQQLMLSQFKELGNSCQDLLLMFGYHRLTHARIAEVIGLDGQTQATEDRRQKCLLMVREAWQAGGITDPIHQPSPLDEQLIDRYFGGHLSVAERWDVEARRPVDSVFRRAMELREDWAEVVTVAGRQDLMATLEREEAKYAKKRAVAPTAARVKLSPRRKGGIRLGNLELPSLQTLAAVILFGVFGWVAWTTFGPAAPQRVSVAHFEPFYNIFDRTPPRNAAEEDLQRILYYYDRADYATAYDELLPVARAYPAAPLYLGVSALALQQPTRALDWLGQIPDGDYYHPFAEWYEALAYLAEGRKVAAETLLRDLAETPGHPYRSKATEVLASL